MLILLVEVRSIQKMNFHGLIIHTRNRNKNFNLLIKFFETNVLILTLEEIASRFCTYLGTTDILKLCFVSKMIRQSILRVFHKVFNVSVGFCSSGHWFQLIKMNCLCLIEDINANFFEDRFIFDFDEYYSKMLK